MAFVPLPIHQKLMRVFITAGRANVSDLASLVTLYIPLATQLQCTLALQDLVNDGDCVMQEASSYATWTGKIPSWYTG